MMTDWKDQLLMAGAVLAIVGTLFRWGRGIWTLFALTIPQRFVVAPMIAPILADVESLTRKVDEQSRQIAKQAEENHNLWKLVLGDQYDGLERAGFIKRNSPLTLVDIRGVLTDVGYRPKPDVMNVFREVVGSGLTREGDIASLVLERLGWRKLQEEADELKISLAQCMTWWIFCTQEAAKIGGADEVFRQLGMIE